MNRTTKSGLLGLAVAVVGGALLCAPAAKADTFDVDFTAGNVIGQLVVTASPSGIAGTDNVGTPGTTITGTLQVTGTSALTGSIAAGIYSVSFSNAFETLGAPYNLSESNGTWSISDTGLGFSAAGTNWNLDTFQSAGLDELYNQLTLSQNGVGIDGSNDGGFTATVTPTPLPSTWLMMLAGLVGFGFIATRGMKENSGALAAA